MTNTRSAALQWRRTASDRPETLVSALRDRVLTEPDAVIYEFLDEADGEVRTLTLGELDLHARHVGARLQALGAQGARAILLMPAGIEFVCTYFGCLYAGAVAVPMLPPEDAAAAARLHAVMRDSGARFVLTSSSRRPAAVADLDRRDVTVMAPFATSEDCSDDWSPPFLEGASLAHLQYTTGPAGSARGVMLSHRNLVHNSEVLRRAADIAPEDRLLSWVAPHHELGLMLGLLQPLHSGCTALVMDPSTFLRSPISWLRAISDHHITVAGAPNFAYDLCVRHTAPDDRFGLDLRGWRLALNGSEAIQARTLAEFSREFAPHGFDPMGFYPFYSVPEATLLVTGGGRPTAPVVGAFDGEELEAGRARLVTARTGRLLASCGQPRPGQLVRIVDPETGNARAAGEVGEIWVAGPAVSAGYWRRRAESSDTFGAFIRDSGEGPFVRTGDLGFLLGGELFVTGRLRVRITVGGVSHFPEDIEELVASSHPALRPGGGAAIAVPHGGGEALVIVHEVQRHGGVTAPVEAIAETVRTTLRQVLGIEAHDVVLLSAGTLPRTPTGKVRRSSCRQRYLEGTVASFR